MCCDDPLNPHRKQSFADYASRGLAYTQPMKIVNYKIPAWLALVVVVVGSGLGQDGSLTRYLSFPFIYPP